MDEEAPLLTETTDSKTPSKSHTRDVHILSSAFLLIFLAYGAAQNLESTINTVRLFQQRRSSPPQRASCGSMFLAFAFRVKSGVPTWDSQPLHVYQHFENVRNFLVAVEELKLPAFEASDLERASDLESMYAESFCSKEVRGK